MRRSGLGWSRVCEEFARERTKYFADVEAEVVKLALAIAARVLHREAELDPLLLTGVVRVALEKVAEDSATVFVCPLRRLRCGGECLGLRATAAMWWGMSV